MPVRADWHHAPRVYLHAAAYVLDFFCVPFPVRLLLSSTWSWAPPWVSPLRPARSTCGWASRLGRQEEGRGLCRAWLCPWLGTCTLLGKAIPCREVLSISHPLGLLHQLLTSLPQIGVDLACSVPWSSALPCWFPLKLLLPMRKEHLLNSLGITQFENAI